MPLSYLLNVRSRRALIWGVRGGPGGGGGVNSRNQPFKRGEKKELRARDQMYAG